MICHLFPVENLLQDLCMINPFNPEQSSCIYGCAAHGNLPPAPPPPGPSTPRTKHVSFARSHTLTSFDDVNLGLRSSGRLTSTRSQERLIGGKKPIIASGSIYEPMQMLQNTSSSQQMSGGTQLQQQQHQNILHHPHLHGHQHGHSHGHQHHLGPPIHVHQIVPIYHSELDTQLGMRRETTDNFTGMNMGVSLSCHPPNVTPPSPEVVVVEKKFRNAMKTQATQTELRKGEGQVHHLELSPRTIHKVKVVSQGAQTNGLINGKKLTKSLSEMPNNQDGKNSVDRSTDALKSLSGEHDTLHRTQSEEPPRSPHQPSRPNTDNQYNVMYYNPPPPIEVTGHQAAQSLFRRGSRISSIDSNQSYPPDDKIPPDSSLQSTTTHSDMKHEGSNQTFTSYQDSSVNYDDSCGMGIFDYESNSLPRRACSYHRLDNDLYSNSLPRKDPIHSHEICRHITDCTELLGDSNITDFSRQHLLPPPRQYRKEEEQPIPRQRPQEDHYATINRRMSMVSTPQISGESPFKRDDIRRQSMPVSSRTEKADDGYRRKPNIATMEFHSSEEKEIFIDFKPHISPKLTTKKHPRHRKVQKTVSDGEMLLVEQQRIYKEDDSESNASIENASTSNVDSEVDEEEEEKEDPLYENVPSYSFLAPEIEKRNQFRKRSISLEDSGVKNESVIIKSAPPSPCQDEMLINTSTYPSSDSLANDLTRDHSDGIWNESQVTVLTADPRDLSEPDHGASHLLTPSSKRKNLILQHQQRSSIDTDALDLEDQFTDHSPTASSKNSFPTPGFTLQAKNREFTSTLAVPTNMVTPTIAVTPTCPIPEFDLPSSRRSPNNSRRSSKSLSPSTQDISKTDLPFHQISPQKNVDAQVSGNNYGYIRSESAKWNTNNTDISECSTNTDEYVTCTDTSKRTPGIKTPPTTTSSSSTTQVPVSAQSSQTEKTHGGSSFESASSLYSTRGDGLSEDIPQLDKDDKLRTTKSDGKQSVISTADPSAACPIRSPSHSISSTSSGSYNMAAIQIAVPAKLPSDEIAETKNSSSVALPPATKAGVGQSTLERENPRKHRESISEDDRSDIRYSSSGYYESPHDDEHGNMGKLRRHRLEEDRKRRRTSMKLDIEKENLRALTSPIKKTQAAQATLPKDKSPEKQQANTNIDASSPSKIKRFRPKIRRQLRRTSRDESTTRRPKTVTTLYGIQAPLTSEKLLDCSLQENAGKPPETETKIQRTTQTAADQIQNSPPPTKAPELSSTNTNTNTSVADVYQLKAKSVESLRSVSPGSDSVFYSEADGTGGDPHSHCLHCGKEMEVSNPAIGAVAGDSVESLPCIDNDTEQDIVKPPSDFADSPVTTKTTQRLYKKMDKRFRSEERYHAERGRHFKTRQDNIRAKSEERGREKSIRSPQLLRPAGSSPCVLPDVNTEQKNQIIYRGHYDNSRYSRLTDADVWTQLDHQSFDRHRERRASTESEKSFHAKYQVILHRLVQRRCTLEMYHRQKNNIFRIDKTVVVKSDSGEFGFRIHGSKPVVVAAIEPDTPAESSGLEVGDIIISVNGVQVLDKHHTEVVKIAHAGCETLELEVARTIGVLMNEQQETPSKPVFSGYLWRQSGQAKGAPNAKKWVRRWFCLRPDHCLYYYKTEEDTQPVGAMIMAKHSVEQCPPEIGKPFAFKIDSGEGIPMYVAADSEELANQWMNILKRSTVNSDPWLEKCARALHQPPSGIARPDCFGYLMKLGSRWCGWSKRYCVLKDACLYFYQDANSKNAFGMACLQGYKVASMSTNASGRKNSFEIIPQEPKLRHYYFSTESEMDKKRWISALEYSIDRWIKSG